MNFENEKYEYMLHTWGGFYNAEHKKVHAKEPGYFFFDTKEELNAFLVDLREIENDLKAYHLATTIEEGKHVRYRTIAKMKLVYEGTAYDYEEDFGCAYPPESAHYMFEDGNYACDCNRSLFLKRKYGELIEELDCGRTIEMKDFEVLQVREW
jgi:hypothetical protein